MDHLTWLRRNYVYVPGKIVFTHASCLRHPSALARHRQPRQRSLPAARDRRRGTTSGRRLWSRPDRRIRGLSMQMGAARLAGRRPRHRHTHRPGSADGRPHRGSVRAEDGTGGSPAHDELHLANHVYCSVVSDGTTSIELSSLALIARLAALVPPPRRHVVRYFGVLSSHATSRSEVVPASATPPAAPGEQDKPKRRSRYIRWAELLRRVFDLPINYSAHRGSDRSSSGHPPVPPEVRAGTRRDCSPTQLG